MLIADYICLFYLKLLKHYIFLFTAFFGMFCTVNAQNYLKPNEFFYQPINGLNVVLIQDSSLKSTHVSLTLKAGTTFENLKSKGASEIIASEGLHFLRDFHTTATIANDYTLYYSEILNENDLDFLFKQYIVFLNHQIDSVFIHPKLNYATAYTSLQASLNSDLPLSGLFSLYTFLLGKPTAKFDADSIFLKNVSVFKKSFYCPQNALLIVQGNFNKSIIYSKINKILLDWKDCTYQPFSGFPVSAIQSVPFNSQHVDTTINTSTQLQLYFSGATFYLSKADVLAGLILSNYFSLSETAFQQLLKDSFQVNISPNPYYFGKYISVFSLLFSLKDTNTKILEQYYQPDSLWKKIKISEKELIQAKEMSKLLFIEANHKKEYHQKLSKFFALTDLNYFGKIKDSIDAITLNDVNNYIQKYIANNSFSAVLHISSTSDSALFSSFVPTSDFPNVCSFNFKKNSYELIDENADSIINSIAQWLKINPKQKIKINGIAYENEILQVKDEDMITFYKSNPSFIIAPSSLIPTKKIRLDVYRSMVIIKKLFEKGITLEQISGTGKLMAVNKDKEPEYKVYCTLQIL